MLRDDLAQHYLLGEVFGGDSKREFSRLASSQQQQCQHGETFRSIHPSPPSANSAITAEGIAPARICVVSTEATPRKINTPSPPPPIAAAIVAVPMVVTVATRMPAIMVRAASGNCT